MNILKTIKDKSFEIFWQIGDGLPENILQNFMIWDGVIQVLKIKKNTHIFNKIIWRVIWKLHSFVLFQYNLSFLLNPAWKLNENRIFFISEVLC